MNFTKENKGITIVALVITIIVLLILASIGIGTLAGKNGLINRTKTAAEDYEQGSKDIQEAANEYANQLDDNYSGDQEGNIKIVTITYDANGGEGGVKKQTDRVGIDEEANITISDKTPTRDGYDFLGWAKSKDATDSEYNIGQAYNFSESVTLYAVWKTDSVSLRVNPNRGTWRGSIQVSTISGDPNDKETIEDPIAPNGYKVTFDGNGGNTPSAQTNKITFREWKLDGTGTFDGTTYTFGEGTGTLTAQYNEGDITLPNTTKVGEKFVGWFDQKDGGNRIGGAGDSYTPKENVTLYAHWESNNYTLTINPNGGTYNNVSSNTTLTGAYDSSVTIENPVAPKGYTVTFDGNGGSTPEAITTTNTFSNWKVEGPGRLDGMTYTFGAGDGTLTANYQGGEITLPEAVREGYKFEGWFTEPTGGTLIGNLGSKYTPSKDETIYAHWTINSYTLTVNPNGGTWNGKTENSTITQNFGSVVDIPDPTPPNGYTITFDGDGGNAPDPITATKIFVDWTKDGAGELNQKVYTFGEGDATLTANYEDGVIVLPSANKEGYELNGWINEAGDFVGKPGDEYKTVKDETLTPQWVPNTYTVAFDGNSASGNMTSIEMTYGVEKNLPNNVFTKVGYTFIGWNIDRNATSAQYTDGQSVINLTTENGATVTLYAIWKKDIVISYDANGGSGGPASQTGTMYNSATSVDIKLSDTRPIKEGFSFNGWTDEESSTNVKYQAGGTYSFSSDTTLYAVWGTNSYILTVNPNGGTWNNTTDVSEVSGSYGSTTIIPDPIPPVGDNITFDGKLAQRLVAGDAVVQKIV